MSITGIVPDGDRFRLEIGRANPVKSASKVLQAMRKLDFSGEYAPVTYTDLKTAAFQVKRDFDNEVAKVKGVASLFLRPEKRRQKVERELRALLIQCDAAILGYKGHTDEENRAFLAKLFEWPNTHGFNVKSALELRAWYVEGCRELGLEPSSPSVTAEAIYNEMMAYIGRWEALPPSEQRAGRTGGAALDRTAFFTQMKADLVRAAKTAGRSYEAPQLYEAKVVKPSRTGYKGDENPRSLRSVWPYLFDKAPPATRSAPEDFPFVPNNPVKPITHLEEVGVGGKMFAKLPAGYGRDGGGGGGGGGSASGTSESPSPPAVVPPPPPPPPRRPKPPAVPPPSDATAV